MPPSCGVAVEGHLTSQAWAPTVSRPYKSDYGVEPTSRRPATNSHAEVEGQKSEVGGRRSLYSPHATQVTTPDGEFSSFFSDYLVVPSLLALQSGPSVRGVMKKRRIEIIGYRQRTTITLGHEPAAHLVNPNYDGDGAGTLPAEPPEEVNFNQPRATQPSPALIPYAVETE